LLKKTAGQCLKLLVSAVLVWWLLRRIGIGRIAGLLRNADGAWLLVSCSVFFASHLLGSLQWRLLLKAEDIRLGWWRTVSFYFIGLFFNNFLIGGMGGDVFRMVDVRKCSKKGTAAVSGVVLDRMMGFLALSGIAVLAVPLALASGRFRPSLFGGFVAMVLGWLFLLLFFFSKRFAKPLTRLFSWLIPDSIGAKMREVYRKIHAFGRQRRLFIQVTAISFAVQALRVLTHYFAGRALGITVSPLYYFLFIPLIAIMASLPISIGGLGLREQTGVVLFAAAGMSAVQAVAVEFLSYLIAIGTSLPGGAAFAIRGKFQRSNPKEE
jgi:glycosyltransferase 2 family protein